MPLELLKIFNGRNLKEFTLQPHANFNIIYGSNGVGKTTILESIYLLLRAKTFRSNKFKTFIHHDENTCTLFSQFSQFSNLNSSGFNDSFSIGMSRSKDLAQPIIHLNTQKINSLSSITNKVVLGLITSESFNLLDSSPSVRRKFIDWGVFHVEHSFLSDWRSHKKILLNRNNILSSFSKNYKLTNTISDKNKELINCWNHQLVLLNNKLDIYRDKQMQNISVYFKELLAQFSNDLSEQIVITFYRGWTKNILYEDYLNDKLNDDLNSGYTRYGTHRSDLKITLKNNLAKDILSRGQKKIVIICLILAQFKFLIKNDQSRLQNILLLDDMDSELDSNNLKILYTILKSFNCQTISTTIHKERYDFLKKEDCKMFHVKQ